MMVYSLNEELGIIEPHRINALLDMGIKPVFKLTTEDGRSIRTTGNHPYLVKPGEWRKVVGLSVGDEIAVLKDGVYSSVDFSTMANSCNQDAVSFPIEGNSIISDLVSVGGIGISNQSFGKCQGMRTAQIKFQFFNNPMLDILREIEEFFFRKFGKIVTNHTKPAFFLTTLPETLPDLREASSEARNSGLAASNSSSSSWRVCLPNTNPSVLPFLSTSRITPSRGNDNLNVLEGSKNTIFSSANSLNKLCTIFSPPSYFWKQLYHSFLNLSSEAYADVAVPGNIVASPLVDSSRFIVHSKNLNNEPRPMTNDPYVLWDKIQSEFSDLVSERPQYFQTRSLKRPGLKIDATTRVAATDLLWDKIVSIEYTGYEQVYDIEVEGTHNFVAGHWVKGQGSRVKGKCPTP